MDWWRINQYQTMWIMVLFDLPTELKKHRKAATKFRKGLLKNGFDMFQFSIYVRHCSSRENMKVHLNRVKSLLPEDGNVCMLFMTDKQFGMIELYENRRGKDLPPASQQLELF